MEKMAPVDRKAWTFGEKRGISIRGCLGRDWFGKGDCLPTCSLLLAPGWLPTLPTLPAWGRCLLALGRGWALLTPGPQALLFFPFLSFPDWNFLVIHMVCSLLSWIIPRHYCIKNLSSAHFFVLICNFLELKKDWFCSFNVSPNFKLLPQTSLAKHLHGKSKVEVGRWVHRWEEMGE